MKLNRWRLRTQECQSTTATQTIHTSQAILKHSPPNSLSSTRKRGGLQLALALSYYRSSYLYLSEEK